MSQLEERQGETRRDREETGNIQGNKQTEKYTDLIV